MHEHRSCALWRMITGAVIQEKTNTIKIAMFHHRITAKFPLYNVTETPNPLTVEVKGEGWLICLMSLFSTSLQIITLMVFAPLNCQMWTHLCNEGFMHCNLTIISLSITVGGLPSLIQWDHLLHYRSQSPRENNDNFSLHIVAVQQHYRYRFNHCFQWKTLLLKSLYS